METVKGQWLSGESVCAEGGGLGGGRLDRQSTEDVREVKLFCMIL